MNCTTQQKKRGREAQKSKKRKKRTLPTDKKPTADAHSKPQPAVALRFLSPSPHFPSASASSTTFHSYLIQASGCLRAQRKSHRHADNSLYPPPHTLSLLFFLPRCFPSYAVAQNGKSDWKWPQVKSIFSSQRLSPSREFLMEFFASSKCVEFHKYIKGFMRPSLRSL